MDTSGRFRGIVAVALFLTIASTATAKYSGGSGTANDPYQIATAADLIALGETPADYDKHFILTADIDLSGFDGKDGRPAFNIIAADVDPVISGFDGTPFRGVFDGKGHMISGFSHSSDADYTGLFGYVDDPNAEVRNLRLVDPNVDAGTGCSVGSLIGCLANGRIINCFVERGWVSGSESVGGIVGNTIAAYRAGPDDFRSEWLNDDPHTRGMTRVIIGREGSSMTVHGYGACSPECDWGTITAPYTGNPFVAVYEFGFKTTILTIRLVTHDSLYVHSSDVFHDGTNRDYEADYFMHRAGGSAAKEYSVAAIATCYSTARVSGMDQVGGLAGNCYATISDSWSAGEVSGHNDVGGLAGYSYGRISGCFAASRVHGKRYAGGLVGNCASGQIRESYATGSVEGEDRVGGLAGAIDFGTIQTCYAAGSVSASKDVGGLIGHSWGGGVSTSFWDAESSGQPTSAGGTGKTTAQMQTAVTFLTARWDFAGETVNGTADIWWILEGKDYPKLWWETANK